MNNIEIRKATSHDKNRIKNVLDEWLDEYPWPKNIDTYLSDSHDSQFVVAEDTEKQYIVGVMGFQFHSKIRGIQKHINAAATPLEDVLLNENKNENFGWIGWLYVRLLYQNRGIGQTMLQEIERIAHDEWNVTQIFGEAWLYDESYDARNLLNKLGFERIFTIDNGMYWFYQRINSNPICAYCEGQCVCDGAIFRKKISIP